ncbi:MAG: helicase-exonuclease AddAB subunit AddA, partial [Oscillospiraceae bacterium]|nr:helicase-exonuclease AddAB subunit AddA [Oscillospiraceae bacterium]
MAMWTSAQESAINAPIGQGNILVSAAAGSGKTAVLVEIIITKVLRGETNVDNLLVVTFTDAAAAEMKEKIISRMQSALDEMQNAGQKTRIQNQLRLCGGADITTIDAFCLRAVKNNFHLLGVDPNFFIADPAESELMMDEVIESLFNRLYVENDERFLRLVDMYSSNRNDKSLKGLIFEIYRSILSFAEPLEWLDEKAEMYVEDMAHSEWAQKYVIEQGCNRLGTEYKRRFKKLAERMAYIAEGEQGTGSAAEDDEQMKEYWGTLWSGVWLCINVASELETVSSWEEAYDYYEKYFKKRNGIDSLIPSRMPKIKLADDDVWKAMCTKRNELKKSFKKDCGEYVTQSAEDFNAEIHSTELSRTVRDIVWLVKEFDGEYMRKKESRNIKEFHDIEHLAYRLFRESENVRGEYRDKYDEILIDEYQDTNGLQDAIFEKISKGGKNIFMVGDLKQSIYRFRGGDPTIFKKKSKSYVSGSSSGQCIVLSQNFRSRQEVLKSVNDLFGSIMSDAVGDVVYEGDELITREDERECYPPGIEDNTSEMHLISYSPEDAGRADLPDTDGSLSDRIEAAYIADKIRELLDGKYRIYDKDLGRYREARCKDITILAKSVRYSSETYINALSSRGIPAFVELEDYFERREIRLMLTLISLINNHLQDIELVSVMRSPIGGFSDNELARIRLHNERTEYFYNAVCSYAKDGDDEVLRAKCEGFVSDLTRWRGYVKQKSVANLIWTIYSETGFYDFMGAIEGGEEAQANLKLLYERAKKYEQSGFKGLFNFLRYIEKLKNRTEDLSGAKMIGENHDVVRIMTIHKSKGLEFPIVFLAGMGKRLRGKPNSESRVLLHKDLGFGMQYADAENSYYKDTLMKTIVNKANRSEELSEVMRLLYVALTRSKEKLIVTAVKKYLSEDKLTEDLDRWRNMPDLNGVIGTEDVSSASTYIDWLCPAAIGAENWEFILKDISESVRTFDICEEEEEENIVPSDELEEAVGRILDFSYKYPKSGAVPAKTSVSALKQMRDFDDDAENIEARPNEYDFSMMAKKPKFMCEEVPGNEIGTAHHQLMAYINMDGLKNAENRIEFIQSEIERIISEGQIDPDAVTEKMAEHCAAFFESELAERMMNAKKIYREPPFQIEIPARLYDNTLDSRYDDEKMILQGIIDCLFEEDDGIVLIDYKTDRVNSVEEIIEKYRLQLDLY